MVAPHCQVILKGSALKNIPQDHLNEKIVATGLQNIVKFRDTDYSYLHFDTHINASGREVFYSQQPLDFEPSSSATTRQLASPPPAVITEPQLPIITPPTSPAVSRGEQSKRLFEEGLLLLEQELGEKKEERRRLDVDINEIEKKIQLAKT